MMEAIRKDNNEEAIRNVLMTAKNNGYRAFMRAKECGPFYGWLITPSGNLLYIQTGYFGYGIDVSLLYVPTAKNGSGCQCNTDALLNVDLNTLEAAEKHGLALAKRWKAQLYTEKQVNGYFDNYWENVIEL